MAWDLGVPLPGDALLETAGRRTGLRRRTPVRDGLEGRTLWLIAQRGRDAGWVRNVEANLPRRLCTSTSKALHTNPLTIRVTWTTNDLA